jgi:siroheme synthase
VIVDASLPNQQVWRGTLDDLAADRVDVDGAGPGTIVIGEVVSLAAQTDARHEEQHVSYR